MSVFRKKWHYNIKCFQVNLISAQAVRHFRNKRTLLYLIKFGTPTITKPHSEAVENPPRGADMFSETQEINYNQTSKNVFFAKLDRPVNNIENLTNNTKKSIKSV